jgi:hypothetical protein
MGGTHVRQIALILRHDPRQVASVATDRRDLTRRHCQTSGLLCIVGRAVVEDGMDAGERHSLEYIVAV